MQDGPVDDTGGRWLGTRRFWIAAAGAIVLGLVVYVATLARLTSPTAVVPVVSLSGPSKAAAGETQRYAVLVRDRHGRPMAGAVVRVGLWKTSFVELARGRTGEGGDTFVDVRFPADFAESRWLVALCDAGVAEGGDNLLVEPRSHTAGSGFVSTDKPLYQPGQTIHLRALTMIGDEPAAEKPAAIEIRTEEGIKVFRAEKKTSAFGVVAADFPLADQVKLGRYTISAIVAMDDGPGIGARQVRAERVVEVQRYALPRLRLDFEQLSPLADDVPLRGVVRARWIFGEPVTRGSVKVALEAKAPGATPRTAVGPMAWSDSSGSF